MPDRNKSTSADFGEFLPCQCGNAQLRRIREADKNGGTTRQGVGCHCGRASFGPNPRAVCDAWNKDNGKAAPDAD